MARSPSPMALATQVNSKDWIKELNAVTTLPLPRRPSGRPSGVIWCSTGPRLLARSRGRCESTLSQSSWSSAMLSSWLGASPFPSTTVSSLSSGVMAESAANGHNAWQMRMIKERV